MTKAKLKKSQLIKLFDNYNYDTKTGVVSSKSGHVYKATHNGYLYHKVEGSRLPFHRMICAKYLNGDIDNLDVDHINGVRSDNRLVNLRLVTRSVNRRNSAKPTNNTSGVVGVSWHKHNKCWEVRIARKNVGYSVSLFEACCIRKSAENKLGDFTSRHGCEN